VKAALEKFRDYVMAETLCVGMDIMDGMDGMDKMDVNGREVWVKVDRAT